VPYSLNLYQIDVGNLINVTNFLKTTLPASAALAAVDVALTQYTRTGFQRFADNSSAFPFRDVVIFVSVVQTPQYFCKYLENSTNTSELHSQIDGFALDSSDIPTLIQWGQDVRSLLQQGSGKNNLEVYTNLANGDEGDKAWYTERKLVGLQPLKAKYDPNSLFSFYNPVSST